MLTCLVAINQSINESINQKKWSKEVPDLFRDDSLSRGNAATTGKTGGKGGAGRVDQR
jgi:hypothetical protein